MWEISAQQNKLCQEILKENTEHADQAYLNSTVYVSELFV